MEQLPTDSTQTSGLLRQVADGDSLALEKLLALYRPYLREIVQLRIDVRLRPRLDASDVVQETELEAFRRIDDYLKRRPMPFGLWLRKTAYQRLIKVREQHVEAAKRTIAREVPLPDHSSMMLAEQLLAGGSTPSQQLAKRELSDRVRRALAQLCAADREVLLMRYLEKLSNQEIGCVLDMEPATVSKRHGRALLRLQKAMVQNGVVESDL